MLKRQLKRKKLELRSLAYSEFLAKGDPLAYDMEKDVEFQINIVISIINSLSKKEPERTKQTMRLHGNKKCNDIRILKSRDILFQLRRPK